MEEKPKKKLRGRPLLIASAGVAATLFVGCGNTQPMGNLKPADCDMQPSLCPPPDMTVPDMIDNDGPFGNLKPADMATNGDGGSDGGTDGG
jgi:hypothetical protein